MLRRSAFALIAALVVPGVASANTITRGVKVISGTGTAFTNGRVLDATELNTDFDTIVTVINGGLDSANIADNAIGAAELAADSVGSADIIADSIIDSDVNSAANIDTAKIGDYSDDDATQQIQTSPGTTVGGTSLATTLEEEIARLRYSINRIAHGSQVAAPTSSWIDPPMRNGNLLYNGSFEVTDGTGSTGSTSAPAGWSNLNTATLAYVDPTDVSEGEGVTLRTTAAGGTDEGVSQTLTNLKASRSYLFVARVKPTAGDSCSLVITGGTSTQVILSTGSGSFETLATVATTTAVPASLVVRLESDADTDICQWDHVGAYELNNDPIPQPGYQIATATLSALDATISTGGTWDDMVTASVTIPGPGYIVKVSGYTNVDNGNSNAEIGVRLSEDCGGGESAIATAVVEENGGAGIIQVPVTLATVRTGLTVGATCVYDLDVTEDTATTNVNVNTPTTTTGIQPDTKIVVELVPTR